MNADIEIIRAPFGGAWACPLTETGESTLRGFFEEEPTELRPLCDRLGYIVEPFEISILAEHLQASDATWEQG
jgi:hypothetical protein